VNSVCRCRNNRSPEPNVRYFRTQRWTLLKSPALLFQCRYAFAVPPSLHDGNGWGIRIDEPLRAIGQRFAMCRMAAKRVRILSANNVIAINLPGVSSVFGDASDTCYIGSIYGEPIGGAGTPEQVWVDADGVLGFNPSSRRVKHDIKPMDKASETLYALKPVTFEYNSDKQDRTQFGLIAKEVAEVNPDLTFRDNTGQIASVRFEQINSMLLNEFLKEHKKVQDLEVTVAQQQKGMEVLTAQLKEQAAQIQKGERPARTDHESTANSRQ
jgi:hypothetical protein